MLATIIRVVVATAVAVFYRLERRGPPVPAGPVLVAANHPNSLLDPILVFATAGRAPRPLAKAPLFERTVVGRLIRWVGGIPVYRREDDPARMARNEDTFRAAIAALRAGDAVQIFPEGRSHSDPGLSPLRTGAARMALAAESEAGWTLGLGLIPVGLTYVRKASFRGRAVVAYGEAVAVAGYREAYAEDPYQAARELTAELDRRLRALTLDLTDSEDAPLIDAAERMWAREKGLSAPRRREPLGDRLPRLQGFARGLAWLRVHDPHRHQRLRRGLERYARRARVLGVEEADVPSRYHMVPTLRWVVTTVLSTVLLAPLALLAVAVWWAPYRLVGSAVARMRLPADMVATYKVAGSLLAYPLGLGLWTAVFAWAWGWMGVLGAGLGLPVLGLLLVPWLDRARDVVEDVRLFARAGRRADRRASRLQRIAAERRALVAEFEAIRLLMDGDPATAGRTPSRQSSPFG